MHMPKIVRYSTSWDVLNLAGRVMLDVVLLPSSNSYVIFMLRPCQSLITRSTLWNFLSRSSHSTGTRLVWRLHLRLSVGIGQHPWRLSLGRAQLRHGGAGRDENRDQLFEPQPTRKQRPREMTGVGREPGNIRIRDDASQDCALCAFAGRG